MSGIYLLDANAAIALIEGNIALREVVGQADTIYNSAVAMGELFYGAEKSVRVEANLGRVEEIVIRYPSLPCDVQTAREYGRIRQSLRLIGTPIPENDMWIAATAIQHSLTLLTRDAHFNEVDGLAIQAW